MDERLDREEIRHCMARFSRGIDRLDPVLLRSAFHPDATIAIGAAAAPIAVEEFVATAADQPIARAQHFVTNHRIDLDGDRAVSEAYYLGAIVLEDGAAAPRAETEFRGGRYVDIFERREGEWRIAAREMVADWCAMADGRYTAAHLEATGARSHRGPGDASYDHPPVALATRLAAGETVDREAIRATLALYMRGTDRLDEELMETLVAPGFELRVGRRRIPAADFWAASRDIDRTRTATQHSISNHYIELAREVAYVESYLLAAAGTKEGEQPNFIELPDGAPVDELVLVGCRYSDRLERHEGRWLLASRELLGEWSAIVDCAGMESRRAAATAGFRDRRDPSYARVADAGARFSAAEAAAREAIRDCVLRFVRGIDRCDDELIQGACWSEESALIGRVEDTVPDLSAVAHYVRNDVIALGPERARAEAYLIVVNGHRPGDELSLEGRRVLFDFECREGEWRIVGRDHVVDWYGSADGSGLAAFLASRGERSRRSREDPSYAGPIEVGIGS